MSSEVVVALVLLAGAVLVGPVLAIIALVRLQQLAHESKAASAELRERLRALERRMDFLSAAAPVSAAALPPMQLTSAPVAATPTRPPPPPLPPRSARTLPVIDFEAWIAGRWLNRVGVTALLLAVGFFLKYAFDNDWIGPRGRVLTGLLCGAALLAYSHWLLRRGYPYFSEGIAAIGAGTLYLSLYAAWGFYDLLPAGPAFCGMALVTASLAVLAVARDSPRLALLALLGGLMAPGLFETDVDRQLVLFSYLAVLDAGLLVLAGLRSWRLIEPLALAGTVFYFTGWYSRFYTPHQLVPTLAFAALLFAIFAALPLLAARRHPRLTVEHCAIVLANVAWFLITLHVMLYRDHRWGLTFAVLILAAAHIASAWKLRPAAGLSSSPAGLLYASIGWMFATLAIPIRLAGQWITIAWAIEGALLVWGGFRAAEKRLRAAGVVLFVLVLLRLCVQDIATTRVLFNARFATFAVTIAAFASAFILARRHREQLAKDEVWVFGGSGVAANVVTVWALSLEVWDFGGRLRFGADRWLVQQLSLSVLWTACASILILAGVRFRSAALRWQGLVLLGMSVLKVFLFDLSSLERIYRILSFLALGIVLLVISFLYQRRLGERATS